MKAEYKRDMNHNYLILYGENEINTDSYQVRLEARDFSRVRIKFLIHMQNSGNGRTVSGIF